MPNFEHKKPVALLTLQYLEIPNGEMNSPENVLLELKNVSYTQGIPNAYRCDIICTTHHGVQFGGGLLLRSCPALCMKTGSMQNAATQTYTLSPTTGLALVSVFVENGSESTRN